MSFFKNNFPNISAFDQLTYSSRGLLIQYKNNPEIEISFADIDKIYIKKHKLHPALEFVSITIPFLIVVLVVQYFPSSLLILISIVAIVPIFMRLINYKWYSLCICLKDGSLYRKKISMKMKMESFSVLEKIRAAYFNYNTSEMILAQEDFRC